MYFGVTLSSEEFATLTEKAKQNGYKSVEQFMRKLMLTHPIMLMGNEGNELEINTQGK